MPLVPRDLFGFAEKIAFLISTSANYHLFDGRLFVVYHLKSHLDTPPLSY